MARGKDLRGQHHRGSARRAGAEGEPIPLTESLQELGVKIGLGDLESRNELARRWAEVVGETVALHSEPLTIERGVLVIGVEEPAWATEMRYRTAEISERASDLVGPGKVTSARVVVRPRNP